MQLTSDWWSHCAFIRDYFFGEQQKLAQQLAAYLAEHFVGDEVSELRPDTDVSALVAASIRESMGEDGVMMALDEGLFAAIDWNESITFMELVSLVSSDASFVRADAPNHQRKRPRLDGSYDGLSSLPMTIKDGSTTAVSPPENTARRADDGLRLNAEQHKALDFLRPKAGKATRVLVGDPSTGKTTILNRLCAELVEDRIVLRGDVTGPANSFMSSLLRSAGLNPEKLSGAVRENLLTVFLEHQKTIGRRVVIAVDRAEQMTTADCSELEHLQTLQLEDRADLELIVVGRPKVYEHIRSPGGGWRFAGTRFHTLRPVEKPAPRDLPTESDHLIISQYGDVIDRPPLKTRTLIGRSEHNDVCLKHPIVSRHHAVIEDTQKGYYVADLSSKNGLIVNGKRVTSAVLRDNDVMVLGSYRIKFVARGYAPVGDPRPALPSLSDTVTMRVKQLRRHLESSLLGVNSAS